MIQTNKQMEHQNLFACYNPRLNFQTRWTIGHNFLTKNNNNADIYYNEEDGNTAMTNNTGKQQHKQYMYSEKDLKDRYMVLGDNAQMDKSMCMIFIREAHCEDGFFAKNKSSRAPTLF
jgi:hypothetical protein